MVTTQFSIFIKILVALNKSLKGRLFAKVKGESSFTLTTDVGKVIHPDSNNFRVTYLNSL